MTELKEKLVNKELYETSIKNYLKKIEAVKEILIWRASSSGEKIYKFLENYNIEKKVKGFIDSDPKKYEGGGTFKNLNILTPAEALKESYLNNNLCIIVADPAGGNLKNKILSLGFESNKLDVLGYHFAHIYLMKSINMIQTHLEAYEKVFSMLNDKKSKEIYLAKLNYLMSGNSKYLENLIDDSKQYFDRKIIKLIKEEVFVDCGSFNGDTLEEFYKLSKGDYKEYIALEADNNIYIELIKKIKDKNYTKIESFNIACWNEKTYLNFNNQGNSENSIIENGNILVQADSLDNLLGDKPVTFIKMDIEGAEENALKGAKKLIKKYKPILAISIYHKVEDYYKLPLLMKKYNEDYRLFIRHYSEGQDNETICYAIPEERLV